METLAEPGVASHGHFPMNMSGYTPSCYYPGSNNRSSQSFSNYHPGYPMVPESDHPRAVGQGGMYPPEKKYSKGHEDVRGEKSGAPIHQQPQHSPVNMPSTHQYMHQTQHNMPLSYFPQPSMSKSNLFKDVDKQPDQSVTVVAENTKKMKTDSLAGPQTPGHSFPQEKFNQLRGVVENQNYSVAKDVSMYNERLQRGSYYKHASRQPPYAEDSHQAIYKHSGYPDGRVPMKSSYSGHESDKRNSPSVKAPVHMFNEGTTMFQKERLNDNLNHQYREWMHGHQSREGNHEQMMNLVRKQDKVSLLGLDTRLSVDPFSYRNDSVNIYNLSQKDDQFLRRMKERQNLHSGVESVYAEKSKDLDLLMQRKESTNGIPYPRNEATLNLSRTDSERCRTSLGDDSKEVSSHKFSESSLVNALPDLHAGGRSPGKSGSSPDTKIQSQNHSVIHSSTPAKLSSNPPSDPSVILIVDGRSSVESSQKPKWGSPASPLSSHYKQMLEEKSDDQTEENNSSKDEHGSFEYDNSAAKQNDMSSMDQDEISSPGKSIVTQGSSFPFYNPNSKLTNPMTASSPINDSKHQDFDDDEGTKLEDGGRFKKEVFSDDGCDEISPYPGSRAQSPPSPDSSMTYPPHFPHPFFASPNRGHPSVQNLQFGSPRAPHELTPVPGYPYGKDFPGRFSISGLTSDMGMGGPMSGHGGPYLGPMPSMGPMGDDKDIFFCHLCSYSGKSKPEFDAHMKFHFEYNCPHCDYTSRTEGRLKRHIKDFHSDDSARRSMPGRPKVYKCKQCQFSATEKDKFWEHARSHIKEDKLLQCPKCPFVTEYKHHLEYHLRNHFNSKPFKCNKCNYSCVNKSMLNSHMKSHTNVYQYRCSNCTYATKYCHSLKLHLRKYNHKPATVLNQDGSLPQGLDVEASGLSIVTKRGPPRGPRGPRKDKNEAYINHLYNMQPVSLGINPMMNGMMPFWPMMPHMGIPGHTSGHSNILTGMGNFPPPMRTDGDLKSQMESSSGDIDNSSDDGSSFLKDEDVSCRLCEFVGETTQGLCLHFVQAHQNEAREVAKAYGVSEATMVESMTRSRLNTLTDKRRLSEPLLESDTEHNPHEFYERNSIAGLLSRKSPEIQNDQKVTQLSPGKWPVPYSENTSMKHYRTGCLELTDDNCGQVDILQQMTLKFGDGTLSGQKAFVKEDVIKQYEAHLKETPLDLTKPKSDSPQMSTLPSSPDRDDYCYDQEKGPTSANDFQSVSNNAQLPLRKRAIVDPEEPELAPGDSTKESSIVPRKRSRKGKAYKLDTLCMKLQERQISTSLEADESGSDTEISFQRFQPLQSVIAEREHENDINKSSVVKEIDQWGASGHCSPLGNSNSKVEHLEEKSDGEDTDEYEMKDDDESEKAILIESDDSNSNKGNKDGIGKKPDENLNKDSSNDVESEFEKLKKSLNILNNGLLPKHLEEAGKLDNAESRGTEIKDESENVKIEVDEKKEDEEKLIERENVAEDSRSEKTQDMEVDPVEMINTVLENRKKSLPPAVRRGTELAWKLLHDTVNPVTSIPLPIDSPPPQAQTNAPTTTTSMSSAIGAVTLRNNSKLTPPFSYPARSYPPHHSTQPLLNPPIPIPIPPTPMAFIPPSSHLMPEAAMIRPMAPLKLSKQEEYSCTFCGLSFQDCVMYTVHMGYHSNKNPFKCNSCGIVCRDKVEFFLHIARSPHA